MRILLDENLDWRLSRELSGQVVDSVPLIGWAGLKNGELLARANGHIYHDGCQPLVPAALCRIGNRCGDPEGSEQPTCRYTFVNAQSFGTPTHIVSRYMQPHIMRPAEPLATNASTAFSSSRTDTSLRPDTLDSRLQSTECLINGNTGQERAVGDTSLLCIALAPCQQWN